MYSWMLLHVALLDISPASHWSFSTKLWHETILCSWLRVNHGYLKISFRWIIHFWFFCFIWEYKASLVFMPKYGRHKNQKVDYAFKKIPDVRGVGTFASTGLNLGQLFPYRFKHLNTYLSQIWILKFIPLWYCREIVDIIFGIIMNFLLYLAF